jgi:hypothetical protein
MRAAAHRVALPVVALPPDREAQLARDGWLRRFVASGPRLDEMVALYLSLGLDVRLELLSRCDVDDDCADCLTGGPEPRIIYTRERP